MESLTKLYMETPEFKVVLEFEYINDEPFIYIHVDINKFNLSIIKLMREVFNEILFKVGEQGFEQVYAYTENLKFANIIIPYDEYIGRLEEDEYGKTYHVVSWWTHIHKGLLDSEE